MTGATTADPRHSCRLVGSWLAEPSAGASRELDGTWVLADLSGFTALTEVLDLRGPDGAEVLHGVLTRCFGALLARSIELGGDIVGFAGDAALVRFDGPDHERRGAEAALAMPAGVAAIPASATGGRRLEVSVGVHSAAMLGVLTRTDQRGFFLCGPATSRLARLEAMAPAGGVLVSDDVAAALDRRWLGRRLGGGIRLRPSAIDLGMSETFTTPPDLIDRYEPVPVPGDDPALALHGPGVRRLLTSAGGTGDHRKVSIGFVEVTGLEAELARGGPDAVVEALEVVAATTAGVSTELSVEWLGSDIAIDGVRLLLTAGAPRAVPDDEERLLVALRRIVDDSWASTAAGVSVRAGAQRGAVFAGGLGVPGRHSYTVLGDPVNVAARALGLARPGEVVVADGLGVTERPHLAAVSLGEATLKNRRRPMSMWRLGSVDSPVARRPLMPPSTARLVRVGELASITETWSRVSDAARAAERSGAAIAIVGDHGMGVSELVAEAASLAGDSGTLIVPDQFRRPIPYGGVVEVVEALHRAAGSPAVGPIGAPVDPPGRATPASAWLASFARLLPEELRPWVTAALDSLDGRSPAGDLDPRLAASQTRAALVALIVAASPRPWLLAVDDLEVVDDSSRAVLAELVARVTADRVDDEPPPGAGTNGPIASSTARTIIVLGTSRAELVSDPSIVRIDLAPIEDDRARRLVREIAPSLRDDQVEGVVTAAGGTPIVLVALARHTDGSVLPDSLQRLAAVQLDQLPPSARDLVRDASVLGTSWTRELIATILARPELVDPVWWADADAVVHTTSDGSMAFRNEAVRSAAYSSLSFGRRRWLHGLIADELGGRTHGSSAALALHLEAAGRRAEALPHAIDAGTAAKAAGALVEAADLLDRAVRMARTFRPSAVPDLLCDLGQTLVWIGDLDRAGAAYRSASLVLARRRSGHVSAGRGAGAATAETSETLRQIAWLAHLQADLALVQAKLGVAAGHVRRGLLAIEPLGDEVARERCRLLLDQAWVHIERGEQQASLTRAALALMIAQRTRNPILEGLAHLNLTVSYGMVMSEAALFHGDEAIRLFEETGQDDLLGPALGNVALIAVQLGRYDEAIDRYRRAAALALRYGRAVERATQEMNIGYVLARRGQLVEAEAVAAETQRSFERLRSGRNRPLALSLRGIVALESGRFTEAEEIFDAAREASEELGLESLAVDLQVNLMDVCLRTGRLAEVLDRAAAVRGLARAEVYTLIEFDREVGTAEALLGRRMGPQRSRSNSADDAGPTGQARVIAALERARALRMPFEEYRCLGSLLTIEELGGPPAPPGTAAVRAALADRLGISAGSSP